MLWSQFQTQGNKVISVSYTKSTSRKRLSTQSTNTLNPGTALVHLDKDKLLSSGQLKPSAPRVCSLQECSHAKQHFPTWQVQSDSTEAAAPSCACSHLRLNPQDTALKAGWGGKKLPDLSTAVLFPDCGTGRFFYLMLTPLGLCHNDWGGIFPFFPGCPQALGNRYLFQKKENTSDSVNIKTSVGWLIQKDRSRPCHQPSTEVQARKRLNHSSEICNSCLFP